MTRNGMLPEPYRAPKPKRKPRTKPVVPVVAKPPFTLVVTEPDLEFHKALIGAAEHLESHGHVGHATIVRIVADDYTRKCLVFGAALKVRQTDGVEQLVETMEAVRDYKLSGKEVADGRD